MKHRDRRSSSFQWIDDGWIEVREDGVTVWRERGDTMEPVVTLSAADFESERSPPSATLQTKTASSRSRWRPAAAAQLAIRQRIVTTVGRSSAGAWAIAPRPAPRSRIFSSR